MAEYVIQGFPTPVIISETGSQQYVHFNNLIDETKVSIQPAAVDDWLPHARRRGRRR